MKKEEQKMRKILSLVLLVAIIFVFNPLPAMAIDTSTDSSQSIKEDKDQSQSQKKSKEEKDSKGRKKSKTTSTGIDKQTQEAVKAIAQASLNHNTDVVMNVQDIFFDYFAGLETTTEPFKTCKIATHPRLARDFGINAEVRPGVIDVYKADFYRQAGETNADVSSLADEAGIRAYRDCMALYGATIAQAYLNLTSDINSLKSGISKGTEGNVAVQGMGYDDFILLAEGALHKAIQGIDNKPILKTLNRIRLDNTPCRFEKSRETIQCGAAQIHLSVKPTLIVSTVEWFGNKFAGFQGSYKISKGWSLSDALEKLKSTSSYSKFASEVSAYAENLESQGKSKEAVSVKKKAWDLAKSSKYVASPSQWLQGLQQ